MTTKGDEMSKDLLVLADEYAAATATFARALALKDEADSMSPIAREAGNKRAVLAEALSALDTAQPVPVNAMLVEALERMVESVTGVDQVSAVDEARAALTAAQQAQPPAQCDTAITYMTGYSDGREWAQQTTAAGAVPCGKTDYQSLLREALVHFYHDGVPTDSEHPKRITVNKIEKALK